MGLAWVSSQANNLVPAGVVNPLLIRRPQFLETHWHQIGQPSRWQRLADLPWRIIEFPVAAPRH
jgi:hypothetical protein